MKLYITPAQPRNLFASSHIQIPLSAEDQFDYIYSVFYVQL